MKKFKFRLEPLMRYREFLERQKQLEVAKARSDVLSCEPRCDLVTRLLLLLLNRCTNKASLLQARGEGVVGSDKPTLGDRNVIPLALTFIG